MFWIMMMMGKLVGWRNLMIKMEKRGMIMMVMSGMIVRKSVCLWMWCVFMRICWLNWESCFWSNCFV